MRRLAFVVGDASGRVGILLRRAAPGANAKARIATRADVQAALGFCGINAVHEISDGKANP